MGAAVMAGKRFADSSLDERSCTRIIICLDIN
jgi:hypothetical protein